MADADSLLEAGALVPIRAKVRASDQVDQVSARSYSHRALAEPVVRLSADNLAQGDDLAMETLGFDSPVVHGPLALQRRKALGFPGWALINDPDHASYALAVVKDMNREKRRAKSKPGHAYDGFTEIAKRLGASVAHFLPSYWEEVGRIFIEAGNSTFASRSFGKAREAERVHALEVNEDIRRDAFLEFALAGALTIKAVSEYGKELEQALPADEAWRLFRELCVRRTLGGMSPWATMGRELDRLLKNTELDKLDAQKQFLVEIIESPSMRTAAEGFWRAMQSALGALANENPRAAGILLNLLPDSNAISYGDWLEHVERWGILENVWNSDAAEPQGPDGGAAAWLSRAISHQRWVSPVLMRTIPKMATRLRDDELPVNPAVADWGRAAINLDLLDLLLELQVPVEDPPEECEFRLTREWACPPDGAVDQPRDPRFVAADSRFTAMLTEGINVAAGSTEFEEAAAGMIAMADARKAWLLGRIEALRGGAIFDAERRLQVLTTRTSREVFQEFPEAFEMLKKVDVVPCLQATLQGGLLDEYGWPALEQVVDELGDSGKVKLDLFGAFPHVIVTNGVHAAVVGRDGVELRHELRLPKGHMMQGMIFVDDKLGVYSRTGSKWFVAWSDAPARQIAIEARRFDSALGGALVPIANGGVFTGYEAFYANATSDPPTINLPYFDGEHFWATGHDNNYNQILREWQPGSDGKGRPSKPSFLEDFVKDDEQLLLSQCYLLHYGDLVKNSPLGSKDGLVGTRAKLVKRNGQNVRIAEDITGRIHEAPERTPLPNAFLAQVAGDHSLLVHSDDFSKASRWSWNTTLLSADGKQVLGDFGKSHGDYNRGQAAILPVIFWHLFQPRDLATSQRLRSILEADARRLADAASKDLMEISYAGRATAAWKQPTVEATIDELFPDIDARLRLGLLGLLARAGQCVDAAASLCATRDPSGKDVNDAADAEMVEKAARTLHLSKHWRSEPGPLVPHVNSYAMLIRGELEEGGVPPTDIHWFGLLDQLDARLWTLAWELGESSAETDASRKRAIQLLTKIASTGVFQLPGSLRILDASYDADCPHISAFNDDAHRNAVTFAENGNTYLLGVVQYNDCVILEHSPTAKFVVPAGFKFLSERVIEPSMTSEELTSVLQRIDSQPRPTLSKEQLQELSAAMGVELGIAALLWVGGAFMERREKNFLPKELREDLGLKVAEADAARNFLNSLDQGKLNGVISAMIKADPWEAPDSALAALAKAWKQNAGESIQLSGDVAEELNEMGRSLWNNYWNSGPTTTLPEFLKMIGSPDKHPILKNDPKLTAIQDGWRIHLKTDGDEAYYSAEHLRATLRALVLLNYRLPVGDDARSALPHFYVATQERLEMPNLLLEFGNGYFDENVDTQKVIQAVLVAPKQDREFWFASQKGKCLWASERRLIAAFSSRVALDVEGFRDITRFADVVQAKCGRFDSSDCLLDFAFLNSSGVHDMVTRIVETPVPEGQWEQNPVRSAPALVDQVASKGELSPEAASYYLQLLTLPDPTDQNIQLWNDWKPNILKKAAAELSKIGWVLEAKRSRAGRKFFVPGAWEALKKPHLPIERWKLALYKTRREPSSNALSFPLDRMLPHMPIHEMFDEAWKRVEQGDAPAYEEV